MISQESIQLRDAHPDDFAAELALNFASVAVLSPLTLLQLQALHGQAAYHRVIQVDGSVVAFLLALAPGAVYDSLNYQWFCARGTDLLYIDRIVVGQGVRSLGLGRLLYQDLVAFARDRGVGQLTCEYDLEPCNVASQRFHAAFGFQQVGVLQAANGHKVVSLQALALGGGRPGAGGT